MLHLITRLCGKQSKAMCWRLNLSENGVWRWDRLRRKPASTPGKLIIFHFVSDIMNLSRNCVSTFPTKFGKKRHSRAEQTLSAWHKNYNQLYLFSDTAGTPEAGWLNPESSVQRCKGWAFQGHLHRICKITLHNKKMRFELTMQFAFHFHICGSYPCALCEIYSNLKP